MLKLVLFLSYLLLALGALAGWWLNLIALISLFVHHAPLDTLFLGRVIGVPVALIGAILGWM